MAGSIGLLAASAGTWAVCRWWYGGKLLAAAHRLHKSDEGRLFSQQQAQQARRQVERLQTQLASHQKGAADSQAARDRTADLQSALLAAERSTMCAPESFPPPSPSGFADTQIMLPL